MRRGSHDMQVNVAGIRRNIKNFAHNYSDAQKKVREATSNDPWGPSSTIMAEIADLTYNVVAFSEIMQMVWKRLNDHGRNWRHVYKALVLLEYLIKTGSEKVGQQCKENIFAIKTLKDFQHLEEGKDQGQNVREKAKQLVNLLKDDERLKNERARALKAKERFAQSASGFGSDGGLDTPTSPRYPAFRGDWNSREAENVPREIEISRPQTAGEEELQLQLALAMSREEAEQEEQKRKSDDVRLQLALSQSQQDFKDKSSAVVDLLDVNVGEATVPNDPWGMQRKVTSSTWQTNSLASPPNSLSSSDPWKPTTNVGTKKDPWGIPTDTSPTLLGNSNGVGTNQYPWSPTSPISSTDLDEFDVITNRNKTSPNTNCPNLSNENSDPFELNILDALTVSDQHESLGATKKTPQSFLGENSALVNLDNLVTSKPVNAPLAANPFSDPAAPQRPVFNTPIPKPTINEIKQQSFVPFSNQNSTFPLPGLNSTPVFGINSSGQLPVAASSDSFNSNGNGIGRTHIPTTQDPWAPASSNINNQNSSPWMKSGGEQANPFLS